MIYAGRDCAPQSRKARAILGVLALSDEWRQPRERFVGLLWGEFDNERARQSLRQSIRYIHKELEAVGCESFQADRLSLRIDPRDVDVDLWQAIEGAKAAAPPPFLLERDRVTESILADCDEVDPSFRDWLMAKRQSLHDRLVTALEDSLRRCAQTPGDNRVELLARAIVKLDPTHEEAARALIQARAAAGDLGGAFGVYKSLWDLLETEYEIQPSDATRDLIAKLRLDQPEPGTLPAAPLAFASPQAPPIQALVPTAAAAVSAPHSKLTLNIGGFDMLGVREERRYLISAFRQELSACLVRFREWSVRDQAHAQAGSKRPDSSEGEHTIDGSAFETSDGVRLVLMLRDAVSGEYVWSERLHLSLQNWFDAQQAVVRRLATTLNVHLSAERLASLDAMQIADPSGFDLWLQGQTLILKHNPDDWQRGVDLVEEAIKRIPTYSPAFSALANAYNSKHIAFPGIMPDPERTSRALAYAQEAVRLDPVNSRAQLCLAWTHAMARQPDAAATHAELARELNDNDPWTSISAITCLRICAKHDLADRLLAISSPEYARAGPLGWAYHAISCLLAGDLPGCVDAGEKAGNAFILGPAVTAAALSALGQPEQARMHAEALRQSIRQRWQGAEADSDQAMFRWLVATMPIHGHDEHERWRAGLIGAGFKADDSY